MITTIAPNSATPGAPARRRFSRTASRGLAITAIVSLAVMGLMGLGASAVNATGEVSIPGVTNSTLSIDCSNSDFWNAATNNLSIPVGTAVAITAANCTTEETVGAGIHTDTSLLAYSIAADTDADMILSLSDGDSTHTFTVSYTRADVVADPTGVLNATTPSTIASTGYTAITTAVEDGNLTEGSNQYWGYLGGNDSCGIEVGKHPYSTTPVTIGLDGSYTFRVVATSPLSSHTTFTTNNESPIDDPFLAVYSSFDPTHPGVGIIGCNDDGNNDGMIPDVGISSELYPEFSATLAPGDYTLVLATYGAWEGDSFSDSGLDQSALYQMWGPAGGIETEPAPGVAPVITSAAAASTSSGVAFSFAVTATGTPAPTFAVTAGSLPAGVALDAVTGLLSGTAHTAGKYSFTITATNATDSTAQAFTLTVGELPVVSG